MKDEAALEEFGQHGRGLSVPEDLEATSLTVLAAHDTPVRRAIANVQWARRGVLQQLTRIDPEDAC
jgi:hypothetical protein